MIERKCSHGLLFRIRCVECELITAREALAHAKDNLEKYSKLIVKLECEKKMSDDLERWKNVEPLNDSRDWAYPNETTGSGS